MSAIEMPRYGSKPAPMQETGKVDFKIKVIAIVGALVFAILAMVGAIYLGYIGCVKVLLTHDWAASSAYMKTLEICVVTIFATLSLGLAAVSVVTAGAAVFGIRELSKNNQEAPSPV